MISWGIFIVYNTFIIENNNQHGLDITFTVKTAVLFRGPSHIPTNLIKHILFISHHFQVVLSKLEAKVFLLDRERFWNEFRPQAGHFQIFG